MQKTPNVTSLVFLMTPHQGCWKAPGWPLGFSFGPQSEIVFAPLFQSFLLPLFWPHCEGGSIYHPTESGQNIKNWGMKIVFSLFSHSCISLLIVCPPYIYLITLVSYYADAESQIVALIWYDVLYCPHQLVLVITNSLHITHIAPTP